MFLVCLDTDLKVAEKDLKEKFTELDQDETQEIVVYEVLRGIFVRIYLRTW